MLADEGVKVGRRQHHHIVLLRVRRRRRDGDERERDVGSHGRGHCHVERSVRTDEDTSHINGVVVDTSQLKRPDGPTDHGVFSRAEGEDSRASPSAASRVVVGTRWCCWDPPWDRGCVLMIGETSRARSRAVREMCVRTVGGACHGIEVVLMSWGNNSGFQRHYRQL